MRSIDGEGSRQARTYLKGINPDSSRRRGCRRAQDERAKGARAAAPDLHAHRATVGHQLRHRVAVGEIGLVGEREQRLGQVPVDDQEHLLGRGVVPLGHVGQEVGHGLAEAKLESHGLVVGGT